MYMDCTGLNMAIGSLEKYRTVRHSCGRGIVPAEPNEFLARGIALHLIIEGFHKGWSKHEIDAKLAQMLANGELLEDSARRAWQMWPSLQTYFSNRRERVVESEFEFCIPVGGRLEDHYLVGRVDAVTEADGVYKVDEYKGRNNNIRWADEEKVWRAALQANTEMLGARSKGYAVNNMLVINVPEPKDENTLVDAITPLWIKRTDEELERTIQLVAQYGDIITMLKREWPPDQYTWPHQIASIWDSDVRGRCNSTSETFRCELRDVCNKLFDKVPEGFKEREEHLDIMKEVVTNGAV